MSKYVLAYHGGGGMAQDEAARDQIMAAWTAWFQEVGQGLVDGGNPIGRTMTIDSGGMADGGGANPMTGYSIIEAGSMDDAVRLAKGCPIIAAGGSIEVAETFDVM